MVEPDVGAPAATGVLIEERTGKIDLAEVRKGDPNDIPLRLAVFADRDAASCLVRYLRFGGRKLAYRLINAQGFEIRFRYDDPLFYFKRLSPLLGELSQSFSSDYEVLLEVVERIGTAAANASRGDREQLQIDHFRAAFGRGADYYPENPRAHFAHG